MKYAMLVVMLTLAACGSPRAYTEAEIEQDRANHMAYLESLYADLDCVECD